MSGVGAEPRPWSGRNRKQRGSAAHGHSVGRPEFLLLIPQREGGALTLPMLNSVAPETSVSLRSATPSENRWWPSNISLRVPLRWPGVRPSGRRLPRPKVGSHTRRLLALSTIFLRKVAPRASVSRVRQVDPPHGIGLPARSGLSPGRCPEASVAPFEGFRGAEALHTSKTVYGLPTSRSRPTLPL